ncbi:MAG TPA: zinc ribbon domain-containing protein [Gemmatimonadales bacterium]|nr:zinc ribbon domain-containing protein [Gemmatimonadales bacterium]
MTHAATSTCAACGAAGTGRFCSSCGAPRGASACRHCGGAVSPGARFCPACGRGVSAGSRVGAPADRTPWVIAGVALVALLVVLLIMVWRSSPVPASVAAAEAPPAAGGDEGAPPDISNMSPRERFDRLYNRVMRAAQAGDEATVTRFTPMALMAYGQLDSLDADARYHAALLQVHSGDVKGPSALADTILAQQPGHLFGYIIRGTVARWQKDDRALGRAYAGFLEHYDAEMKAARPEYADHKVSVDDFHQQALKAKTAAPGT